MPRFQTLMSIAFALVLCASVAVAEDAKPKKKGKRGNAEPQVFQQIAKLELTSDQKEKLEAVKKEFLPKLMELNKELGLTKEDREARATAMKEAKEKGLKGKELREFVEDKAPMTEEQKATQKKIAELNGKIREKLASMLTDEQKEKLGLNKKRPAGNKKKKEAA